MHPKRLKTLFFAEGSTLAHVARPYVLATALTAHAFDVLFARPTAYAWLTQDSPELVVDLPCQSPVVFARRLERGAPLYDLQTLTRYVEDDRALIRRFQPDVIVGDFRLSLAVSARLEGVPYAALCDPYWSPEFPQEPPPLPVLPFTRFVPIGLTEWMFGLISPLIFYLHARPMEALRRRFGLPSIGHDLRLAYTDADLRLFPSLETLHPSVHTHAGARFIGPVAWSPRCDLPANFPPENGLIYVTMGSSGHTSVLPALLDALGKLGLPTVIALAGHKLSPPPSAPNLKIYDYLPGDKVMGHARLAICNGGSPTTTQALLAGVPVLGIVGNMDQMLNMRSVERAGCGITLRADRLNTRTLSHALALLLKTDGIAERARHFRAQGDLSLTTTTHYTAFAQVIEQLAQTRHQP